MSEKYAEALGEQLKKNVYDRAVEAAAAMTPLDRAGLLADVAGIVDPTPVSDTAGALISIAQGDWLGAALSVVSIVPYVGDALGKVPKIARKAPRVAQAIEAVLKRGDSLVNAGKDTLKASGLSLDQVTAARKKALEVVRQAMVDARLKKPNCVECQKLRGVHGESRTLRLATEGKNGHWVGGAQPANGTGEFVFHTPIRLPGSDQTVTSIAFKNGSPDFDKFVKGERHQLWQVTGKNGIDGPELLRSMRESNPHWIPPSQTDYVLHHFDDGTVGYLPRSLHDAQKGGLFHTGGNSMLNNDLF